MTSKSNNLMKYAGAAMAGGGAAMLGTAAMTAGSSIKKKGSGASFVKVVAFSSFFP